MEFGRRRAFPRRDLIDTAPNLRTEADTLPKTLRFKWTKQRGKVLERAKGDGPTSWRGDTFTGDRVNHTHMMKSQKQTVRGKLKAKGARA